VLTRKEEFFDIKMLVFKLGICLASVYLCTCAPQGDTYTNQPESAQVNFSCV